MHPFCPFGDDAWVDCGSFCWCSLVKFVGSRKMLLVSARAITNDDLRGVLVWHHYRSSWESASSRVYIVGQQWLLHHACMKCSTWLECLSHETFSFTTLVHVLMTCRVFPASFLKRICNCDSSTVLVHYNVGASLDLAFFEIGVTLFKFLLSKDFRVM